MVRKVCRVLPVRQGLKDCKVLWGNKDRPVRMEQVRSPVGNRIA